MKPPKVIQNDRNRPVLSGLQNLNSAITAIDGKIILSQTVYYQLIAHCQQPIIIKIAGVLLVATADVDSRSHTGRDLNFSPIPLSKGNYPSIVITSSNDPYIFGGKSAVSGGTMGKRIHQHWPKSPSKLGLTIGVLGGRTRHFTILNHQLKQTNH
jgi:predicted alpha/beta hydrolase family esterase